MLKKSMRSDILQVSDLIYGRIVLTSFPSFHNGNKSRMSRNIDLRVMR
jgi:hypothetical protein